MKILDIKKYNEVISNYSSSICDQPAIFVADYASYNEGHICGAWFDLSDYSDKNEFMEKISAFFKELDQVAPLDSEYPREEMMFQDWQCIPDSLIGESHIDENFWTYQQFIDESEQNKEMFEAFDSCIGISNYNLMEDAIEAMQKRFFCNLNDQSGGGSNELKLGYYCVDAGMIEIPRNLENYFDYEAYGSDWMQDMSESNGYVFSNY